MSTQKFSIKKQKAKTGGKESKILPQRSRLKEAVKQEVEEEVIQLPPAKLRICVIGAGAIGGLVAAYLRAKMRNVFLVCRLEQVRSIRSNGFRVEGVKEAVYVDLMAKTKLEEKVDLIILAVKTQDIKEVIRENGPFMEDALILTTQNGVRADKLLSLNLGEKNIISSVVMFGSTYLKPGLVTHNFDGNWIIGRPFFANDDKVKEVVDELSLAFNTIIVDDIMSMKWTKLFVNLNNCIPALLGKSMQEAFANLDMAKLSILILKEGFNVVDKSGVKLVNLPDFDLGKYRELTQMPVEQSAQIFSGIMNNLSKQPLYGSILQSIKRERSSEIDFINGEIVNLSRFNGVDAILNAKVVNLVHEVEKTKRFFTPEQIRDKFNLGDLK